MYRESDGPGHPGAFIRKHIIPRGMSVTEAAERLGVGRPALSNLLNGNSSLSARMAARLQKAFRADSAGLLRQQRDFDRGKHGAPDEPIVVHPYVPPFLTIKSRQIEKWAEGIEPRHLLPVLLRMLVISTHDGLSRVTFPGYDDGQRRGWDGLVEADSGTPWIPAGSSCWEFGTDQDPRGKAERDYRRGLQRDLPFGDHGETTFVFVTPRRWPGVTEWAAAKQREGHWRAVMALDASDLETWLTQSIPAQTWLAEELEIGTDGVETLQHYWEWWSSASSPRLTAELFSPSVAVYREKVEKWLVSEPASPLVVAADSRGEAIGFLACLFREFAASSGDDTSTLTNAADLATVFHSSDRLRELAASRTPFLPIVLSDDAERELAPLQGKLHCIAAHSRNASGSPDIGLDLLAYDGFRKALDAMAIEGDRLDALSRESGRSVTILRRRLSTIPAIRTPEWAADPDTARRLIPMTLIGTWNREMDADCEVMRCLAGKPHKEIERDLAGLLCKDDSPVWSAGALCGVASKIDALFAIKNSFTAQDLTDFFWLSEYVLSETDPALELPEDHRWAAGLFGKVRNHSSALRRGICETLVILSVHGNHLFLKWPGIDVETKVSSLVRRLLTPLTLEKLYSHKEDVARYAEAAPSEFLRIIESDLRQECPVVLGLLKPSPAGAFGQCPRTGLLWALECLAWKHLAQVSRILGQLARITIDDNWVQKPLHTLKGIYRWWNPQTAASLEDRVGGLKALAVDFPDVAWQVCIEQLPDGLTLVGDRNYRPLWRSDASGANRGVIAREHFTFQRKALDMAVGWPHRYDPAKLHDLVQHLKWMPEDDQAKVWDSIDEWADSEASDHAKAELRERIRRVALTRFAHRLGVDKSTVRSARRAFERLEPDDLLARHAWLFRSHWIEPSIDDPPDSDYDFARRREHAEVERRGAMRDIWGTLGFGGLETVLDGGGNSVVVGEALAATIPDAGDRSEFLKLCLTADPDSARDFDGCMRGFLFSLGRETCRVVLSDLLERLSSSETLRLLRSAPFRSETWDLVDRAGTEVRDCYWSEVELRPGTHSDGDVNLLVERFLDAQRPHAAFWMMGNDWSRIETEKLKRVLLAMASAEPESHDQHMTTGHRLEEALESLEGRNEVSPDDLAQLEHVHIDSLVRTPHGIPNLERQVAESPTLYFQALAVAYVREDFGQDPPGWLIEDQEQAARVLRASRRLLSEVRRLPGTGLDGSVDLDALLAWMDEVRRLCSEYDRSRIGDQVLGQFLSRVQPGEDGSVPSRPVCEVLERTASAEMALGYQMGIRNARGAHFRPDTGEPERRLAAKYQDLAERHQFEYPFVSEIFHELSEEYVRDAGWHDAQGAARKRIW